MRQIAEVIGRGLKVPWSASLQSKRKVILGWLAMFAGLDMPASKCTDTATAGMAPRARLIADLDECSISRPRGRRRRRSTAGHRGSAWERIAHE